MGMTITRESQLTNHDVEGMSCFLCERPLI